ncbi:hypothetical protein HYN69_18095 (plasmid) [Gemmobacter aquarius]|uniref:Glycosyl transferase family 25 domain-containing protein n=1 Tax=Paragemmobacter aquarius TaxID=2169400 RepID=A0A2S0URU5_9RHOB|nr:glycosyltransferase family 25 protein [Gemmobacter aquarius]AWB50525.1 hypothetical protein HYN69_18095 [Gemmobacter aquarius]
MQTASATDRRIPALVLTCRIAPPERRASALAQLAGLSDLLRVEMVDGFIDSDDSTLRLHDPVQERRWTRRPMTLREVATYGTHRCGWQRLIETGADHALLLEDDFILTDPAALRRLLENLPACMAPDVDMLKLFDFPDSTSNGWALHREVAGETLLFPRYPKVGAVGYVLSARGAGKFLYRQTVFRPIDEDLRYYWELGLRVWTLARPLVRDGSATLGGSLLEEERKAFRPMRAAGGRLRFHLIGGHRRIRNLAAFATACLRLKDVTLRRSWHRS